MPTYTIQAVAPQTREYDTKFGHMISYKVKFTTEADAVEISQKPETPAPVAGDVLTGDIIEGQYGKKFKKEFNQGGFTQTSPTSTPSGGQPSKSGFTPRDDSHIKAQWAIGQAVILHNFMQTGTNVELDTIEALARDLFAMVDRVKGSNLEQQAIDSMLAPPVPVTGNEVLNDLFPEVEPVNQRELPWNPEN